MNSKIHHEKTKRMTIKTIDCPGWIHRFLIGKNGSSLHELIKCKKIRATFTDCNQIIVKGPTNVIPKVIESFEKGIQCFTFTEFLVDSNFVKHIIGINGRNINRIRNDTDVCIIISESENNSQIIRIEGRKDEVELVKSELEEIIYKLENEVEKEILIDHRHLRAIFGLKMEKVRELQEEYNVYINFPSSVRHNSVKIRGLCDDVNKAFKVLTKLTEELDEANYVLEISVFKQLYKLVVGKGGANMKKIREETNTRIDVSREVEGNYTIKVLGNKEKVLIACDKIKKIQSNKGDIVTKNIVLGNIKVRNAIVNLGNYFIEYVKKDYGGFVKLKLPAVEGDYRIVINGPEDNVDYIITKMQTLVEVDNSVKVLKVKPEFHKYLNGKNPINIKRIQDLTNTLIILSPGIGSFNENITIVGTKENVREAKAKFEDSFSLRSGECR